MTFDELFAQATVGSIVQVVWSSALFDPEAVIKPGTHAPGVTKIFSCGFIADIAKEYITLGLDAMYESGNNAPSFRTTVTIPAVNVSNAQIYGKVI